MKSLTIKIPERTENIKFANDIDINRDFSIILVESNEECFGYIISDGGCFMFCQSNNITDSKMLNESLEELMIDLNHEYRTEFNYKYIPIKL